MTHGQATFRLFVPERRTDARGTLTLALFVNEFYEPYAKQNLKPSTVNGYTKLWDVLCPRVGEIRLRDFKTVDAANLLQALAVKGQGRRSLQHAKSLLSKIFTYAKNLGVLDGINPVQGTLIPRKAAAPAETHATTPEARNQPRVPKYPPPHPSQETSSLASCS